MHQVFVVYDTGEYGAWYLHWQKYEIMIACNVNQQDLYRNARARYFYKMHVHTVSVVPLYLQYV